jgi:hypothetical protein
MTENTDENDCDASRSQSGGDGGSSRDQAATSDDDGEGLADPLEDLLRPPSPNPPSIISPIAGPPLDAQAQQSYLGSLASALYHLLPGTPPPPSPDSLRLPSPAVQDKTATEGSQANGASNAGTLPRERKEPSPIMVYLRKRGIPTAEETTFDLEYVFFRFFLSWLCG